MLNEDLAGALRLERSKPHSVCFPPYAPEGLAPEKAAHFEQGGFYFDHHGDLVTHEELLPAKAQSRLKAMVARKDADAQAQKARRAALAKKGLTEADLEEILGAKDAADPGAESSKEEGPASNKLDVIAWGMGRAKYPWFDVKKAFLSEFGKDVTNADDAVLFLVEQGKITEDSARPLSGANREERS